MFILDRKTLETIYITFIRPLLEYADVVWDTKTQILINKLENVQVEAARIVIGGTRLVSISNLHIDTGWEKLKDRKERHRTIQFYKMSNNLTPQYLSNLIPENVGIIHDHNTPVRTRTSLYSSYFIPFSVQLWNQQPENIKSSRSVQIIKSNLQLDLKTILNPFIIILVLDWDKFYTLGCVCNAALSIITYFVKTL